MRKPAALLATTFLAAGLLSLTQTAYADTDDVTITTTASVNWWDHIQTKVDWCDPAAQAGDRIVVELPRQLEGFFSPDFSAVDTRGEALATAIIEGRTLSIRINERLSEGTCATATLTSTLVDGRAAQDSSIDLDFGVDGTVIQNRVHVRAWQKNQRAGANAWGEFRDDDDQCRSDGRDCLVWHWDSMAGPFSNGVMRGSAAEGQDFACKDVTVELVRLGEHGEVKGATPWSGGITCEPAGLRVDLDDVPAGTLARVNVRASVTPVAAGGITYTTRFAVSDGTRTSVATDDQTSTMARLTARAARADEPTVRPDERQGIWPFLALGTLLAAALAAVVVRRKG